MSQVSKIDELIARYDRYQGCEEYHIHYGSRADKDYPLEEHQNFDETEFKQALLSIILEALPEKNLTKPKSAIDALKIAAELSGDEIAFENGYHAAIEDAIKNISKVFGVEG